MIEAAWAIVGTVVGAILSVAAARLIQSKQFKHEERMYVLANQAKESLKGILLEMLNHKSYTDRTFAALRERVGGLTDDELRLLLHELGARKTTHKKSEEEWWFLESRRQERIDNKN